MSKPTIAFLHLGDTDSGWCMQFIRDVAESGIGNDFELKLFSSSPDFAQSLGHHADIKSQIVQQPNEAGGFLFGARVRRLLRKLYAEAAFDVLVVFSNRVQAGAGLWKIVDKPRAHLARVWKEAHLLAPTLLNRLAFNRATAANVFPTQAIAAKMREERAPGSLRLDNPFVLQSDLPLSATAQRFLREGLRALIMPTRERQSVSPAQDWSHIRLTYITHFYLNQNKADTVTSLLQQYARYDPRLLDQIHFVIVDDGSPLEVSPPDVGLNLTWLRVEQDIRWNQGGARNLGVVYAKSDNILVTDLDLAFPEETLGALVGSGPCRKTIYKFHEINRDTGKVGKGHPNNFFLSRARFLMYYGYDEEFAGNYGAEDFRFVKFQKSQGTRQRYFGKRYPCFRRTEIDRKSSYHSLVRDLSGNTPVDSRKRFENETYGHEFGHSRMFLNFTWTKITERQRTITKAPPVDRAWKRRWLFRTLLPW